MRRRIILSVLLAACLAPSAPAVAQGRGDGKGRRPGDRRDPHHDHGRRAWQEHGRGGPKQRRRDERRDERGAGPEHRFHRGDRLPPEYRSRSYVVDNWRAHRLNPPPRGYHWVQVGGDYVLVAIATGIILQLVLAN
jgi:Ni/Co efflux regulator RcnB